MYIIFCFEIEIVIRIDFERGGRSQERGRRIKRNYG